MVSSPDRIPDGEEKPGPLTYEAPTAIRQMLFATWALLNSLDHGRREQAFLPMDDERRVDWDFIPKPDRCGAPLFALDRHQRTIAHTLLKSGLSIHGYSQAVSIMATENILRELEAIPRGFGAIAGDFRDPEGYWFSFFGRPGFEDTWGWRVIGHHISFSYTIVGQRYLTVTPLAMGAQPFPAGVLNPLGANEELAFRILGALDGDKRSTALIHPVAPADFATRQVPRVGAEEWPDHVDLGIVGYSITDEDREALRFVKSAPSGLNGAEMSRAELDLTHELLFRYFDTVPEELAAQYRDATLAEDPERLTFAWAGGTDPDSPHYYRISTGRVLVESDNAVAQGQHMHSVWRDLDNDLGHDLLLDHYEQHGHHGAHLRRRLDSTRPENG
ncbi:DUF3500 domain-containing protein [Streptomyces sp. NPDC002426]